MKVYESLTEDDQGRLISQCLKLALVRWDGIYQDIEVRWLRWTTLEGARLPMPQEVAIQTQRHASNAQRQAAEALDRAATLEAELARYREWFGDLPRLFSRVTLRTRRKILSAR